MFQAFERGTSSQGMDIVFLRWEWGDRKRQVVEHFGLFPQEQLETSTGFQEEWTCLHLHFEKITLTAVKIEEEQSWIPGD